jgi:hypothetical protein
VTTTRTVRDSVRNVLDYLADAQLALYSNEVSIGESERTSRISWHGHNPTSDFLLSREHGTVDQYLHWLTDGAYSAILYDGSLLQITYHLQRGTVTAHRLAYIPCPFIVDTALLADGTPVDDVIGLYTELSDVALRSPVRFDYDPGAARRDHPAAHLTINSADCRIACVAPMHALRFADFIFRHFYPRLWDAHRGFFAAASWQHAGEAGEQVLSDEDRTSPHLMWDIHATATEVSAARKRALRGGGFPPGLPLLTSRPRGREAIAVTSGAKSSATGCPRPTHDPNPTSFPIVEDQNQPQCVGSRHVWARTAWERLRKARRLVA